MNHGITINPPFAEYRADDITPADTIETVVGKAVSKSMLVRFAEDPSVWKSTPPKPPTSAMRAGSLFDCLLTEPDQFANRYQVSPFDSFRTKDAQNWKAEMESAGVVVVTESQVDLARAQLKAVLDKPEAEKLIMGSQFQVAFRHKTKYPFDAKGLIDIVPNSGECLVDLKTCEPRALESKRALQRHIFDRQYHWQAGAYCEGFSIANGDEMSRFKFIFVSSAAPIRCAVIELPLAAIIFGADGYRKSMALFNQCLTENRWPSIWDGEHVLDLPEFAYNQSEPE